MLCGSLDGGGIVDIEPSVALFVRRPAMNDEGNGEILQQGRPRIVGTWGVKDNRVDLLAGDGATVGGEFVLEALDGRDQHIDLVCSEARSEASEELTRMRSVAIVGGIDDADSAGATGGEATSAGVRAVPAAGGGFGDSQARRFTDLWIAVQGTAHRGLR